MKYLPIAFLTLLSGSLAGANAPAAPKTFLFACEGTTSGLHTRLDIEVTVREFTAGVPSCNSGVERIDLLQVKDGKISYSRNTTQCTSLDNGYGFFVQGSNLPNSWALEILKIKGAYLARGTDFEGQILTCKKFTKQ